VDLKKRMEKVMKEESMFSNIKRTRCKIIGTEEKIAREKRNNRRKYKEQNDQSE
jgi:hypothetical protein